MKLSEKEKAAHREAFRKMSFQDKMIYIFSYYKAFILIPVILLILAGSFISDRMRRKEDILYLGLVNVTVGEELSSLLDKEFVCFLEEDPKKKEVLIYNGLYLSESASSENERYAYASRIKIIGSIETRKLDAVILNKEAYGILSENGYLCDLRSILTQDLLIRLNNVLVSSKDAIDISRFPVIKEAGFTDDLYFAVIANTPRTDTVLAYLNYLIK